MVKLNVDCLHLIFNELENQNSLYSCLLVNKEWCNIVVPILWKKHSWNANLLYNNCGEPERKLFNTIISCLPSSSKKLLSDNDFKSFSTILSKPISFNYISFCEFPNPKIVDKIVRMMFEEFSVEQISVDRRKPFRTRNLQIIC